MIKNIKILVFTTYLFSFFYANTCNTAEDYGLINSGQCYLEIFLQMVTIIGFHLQLHANLKKY